MRARLAYTAPRISRLAQAGSSSAAFQLEARIAQQERIHFLAAPARRRRRCQAQTSRRAASRQFIFGFGGASGLGIVQFLQNFVAQLRNAARAQSQNHVARLHALHDHFDAGLVRTRVFRAAMAELRACGPPALPR